MRRRFLASWLGLALLLCSAARAELTIEITRGIEGAIPIAVAPFAWTGPTPPPVDVAAVIRADLARSGQFRPLPPQDMLTRPAAVPEAVNWRVWQTLGQDYLVIGQVESPSPERYEVQFHLLDVYRKEALAGYRLPARPAGLRKTAHRIADILYEKITGRPGAFATRIAYVIVTEADGRRIYRLQIADADGYNPRTVVISPEPLMSPAWSPDGQQIAYVSFERRRPAIYVQTLATGAREKIAAFPGINGAPAWSPDGGRLALTLSKDGSPDIYVLDLASRRLRRLTHSFAIDTEPAWSPDGKRLVFTSDRGGSPQIYTIPAGGGAVRRLTFQGNYNARATFSPDGGKLALVHGGQGYRIAVLDLASGRLQVLTDGPLDESPSFAPNGSMILYATQAGGRGQLAAVSVDGRVRQRLGTEQGDVREPAWSPF
ncbi:TolB protein [Methylomarinovum tepidoasis]|uniref:Tol-Pal system protein TolB n=1 Tax=Methylomarinovum tepidoasis TaxID=2840183 RepID=A0AAU9BY73_9GAMM|nr:Tol-Pal system beta propeller repeat protein TolB [Methylomarinovum sp. IN45]BCX88453.1 TolB protein [Methylomarinovum sp. IN45]